MRHPDPAQKKKRLNINFSKTGHNPDLLYFKSIFSCILEFHELFAYAGIAQIYAQPAGFFPNHPVQFLHEEASVFVGSVTSL